MGAGLAESWVATILWTCEMLGRLTRTVTQTHRTVCKGEILYLLYLLMLDKLKRIPPTKIWSLHRRVYYLSVVAHVCQHGGD